MAQAVEVAQRLTPHRVVVAHHLLDVELREIRHLLNGEPVAAVPLWQSELLLPSVAYPHVVLF